MEKTTNYEMFKLLDLNRALNRKHINELKESISKNGYLISNPIIVNADMEILDGQHRFIALKDMGMEIPYVVVDKEYDTIIDLNTTQRKWTIVDYINYYCEKDNNKHFLRLRRLCKEIKLSPSNIITMALGHEPDGAFFNNMKKGILELTIDDELRVNEIAKNFLEAAKLLRLRPTSKLCSALINLSTTTKFRWDTMLWKCKMYPTLAYNCRTEAEFKIMLKNIYNYNQRKEENKI